MPDINNNSIGKYDGGQLRHNSTKIHVELHKHCVGHRQGIYCAIEILDGLITAGGDGAIVLWTWAQLSSQTETVGELLASLPEPIFCITEASGYLWAGTQKGNVFRLKKGEEPKAIKLDTQSLYYIKPWQSKIWVGTGSGRIIVLDDGGDLWFEKQIALASLRCMDVKGSRAWIGGSDASIYEIEGEGADVLQVIQGNHPSVFGVIRWGDSLISAGRDACIRSYYRSEFQQSIPAHLGTIHGLHLNEEGTLLATGSMDKSVKIWSLKFGGQELSESAVTLELKKVIHRDKFGGELGHTHCVNAVLWLSPAANQQLSAQKGDPVAAGNQTTPDAPNLSIHAKGGTDSKQVQFLFSVGDDRQALLWKVVEFCEP